MNIYLFQACKVTVVQEESCEGEEMAEFVIFTLKATAGCS